MKKFEILEHTADLKIKVWGKDLPDLFKNAAAAMYSAACGGELKTKISKLKTKKIEVEGQDYESLLVNFLNELLYLSDVNNKGYQVESVKIVEDVKTKEVKLKAKLLPYFLPPLEIEIKGATYHDLQIKKVDNIYETVVIFDI